MSHKRISVVTGARQGIGRAIVCHLIAKGHLVIGCSRTLDDDPPAGSIPRKVDVGDEGAIHQLFTDIRREYGHLEDLINCAGIAFMNHSLMTPGSTVDRILRTNTLGTILASKEAAKIMQSAKFGRIVNFSTVAVRLSLEGESAYIASKAAVEAFTRTFAKEVGSFGITVNNLAPGPISTRLIAGVPAEKINSIVQGQAIKRMGTFEDVTNVIDFFLAPESSFITGQTVYLGGVS